MFPANEQVGHLTAAQGKHAGVQKALVLQHFLRTQLLAPVQSRQHHLSAPLLRPAAVPPAVVHTNHTNGCAAPCAHTRLFYSIAQLRCRLLVVSVSVQEAEAVALASKLDDRAWALEQLLGPTISPEGASNRLKSEEARALTEHLYSADRWGKGVASRRCQQVVTAFWQSHDCYAPTSRLPCRHIFRAMP
jgi:hypothetical protein